MFCREVLQCLFGFTGTQSPPAEVHQTKIRNRLTTIQEHSRTRTMIASIVDVCQCVLNVRCLSHLTSILVYQIHNFIYWMMYKWYNLIFVQGIFFQVAERLNILHRFWWFHISTDLEASSEVTMPSCSRCSPVHTHSSDWLSQDSLNGRLNDKTLEFKIFDLSMSILLICQVRSVCAKQNKNTKSIWIIDDHWYIAYIEWSSVTRGDWKTYYGSSVPGVDTGRSHRGWTGRAWRKMMIMLMLCTQGESIKL